MQKLLVIASFSETIKEWNDKINAFTGRYMDNAFIGGAVVIVIFAFGCWAISYLTKK